MVISVFACFKKGEEMKEGVGNEKLLRNNNGDNLHAWLPLSGPFKKGAATMAVSVFFAILLIATFLSTPWSGVSVLSGDSFRRAWSYASTKLPPKKFEYSIICSEGNMTTCPVSQPAVTFEKSNYSSTETETCPEYFRWIYEDLKPWRKTGITREMVDGAKIPAHIRIVVVDGKVYTEKYKLVFQTRDAFTVWGILQLLRLYPGKLPDLDLMFECADKPVIKKKNYQGPNSSVPPPLFHYCGDDKTYDIAFPDWSFWGWPEIRIKPWNTLKEELKEGNNRSKWVDREPYAYWRGNIKMGKVREELSKCSHTDEQDWNARIYNLDWNQETVNRFNTSELASQCTYKYKIYAEGVAWSVSEKYILACDSVTLRVKPRYYDFFTRSLLPLVHYWPIKLNDMCKSIKFATEWLSNHNQKAQEIGEAGSSFIQEELRMKFVYDYMFHVLSAYAKLLKYKPTVPPGAVEVCSETMVCSWKGLQKKYKIQSMVKTPSDMGPCTMPPPYDPAELRDMLKRRDNVVKQVEMAEKNSLENLDVK